MEQLTLRDDDGRALFTPYGVRIYCSTQATADCICKLEEALKAHEPRVLTLEELEEDEAYWLEEGRSVGYNVLLREIEKDSRDPFAGFVHTYGSTSFTLNDYGQTWRCWSSKPTDEQREAVPWDTN